MAKKKRKTEFSKKILITSYIIGILILIYAMILQFLFIEKDFMGDSTVVNALVVGAFAEISVVSSVYAWKARRENEIKLRKIYGNELMDDVENETESSGYQHY